MMKKPRYFSTRSRPLVEFLYAKGHPIVGITISGPETTYVLPKIPNLEALIDMYRFGADDTPELYIQVRDFQQAQRELEHLTRVNTDHQQII